MVKTTAAKPIEGTLSLKPLPVSLQPTLANTHQQEVLKQKKIPGNTANDTTNQPRHSANTNSPTPLQKKAAARRAHRTTNTATKETPKKPASVSAPVPTQPSSKDTITATESSIEPKSHVSHRMTSFIAETTANTPTFATLSDGASVL